MTILLQGMEHCYNNSHHNCVIVCFLTKWLKLCLVKVSWIQKHKIPAALCTRECGSNLNQEWMFVSGAIYLNHKQAKNSQHRHKGGRGEDKDIPVVPIFFFNLKHIGWTNKRYFSLKVTKPMKNLFGPLLAPMKKNRLKFSVDNKQHHE